MITLLHILALSPLIFFILITVYKIIQDKQALKEILWTLLLLAFFVGIPFWGLVGLLS